MNLQTWMDKNELVDADVARRSEGALSRSQVSRIRRRVCVPRPITARLLATLTGLPAAEFIFGDAI